MREFGTQNTKTVMLLHGGGLSWWNYREAASLLAEKYHVLLPVLDGHGDSGIPFTSVEDCAARLIGCIDTRLGGQVTVLGGVSLGGQIALEMLSQRPDICRCALIESATVKPSKLTHAMIRPAFGVSYGLIRQKWFSRLQAACLGIPEALFADYYRDTCRIRKEDMIAFLEANALYAAKPELSRARAKVKLLAGSREVKTILDSLEILHGRIPGSTVAVLPGLRHGQLSLEQPRRYTELLQNLLETEGKP